MIKKIIICLLLVSIIASIIFITLITQIYRFWIQDPSEESTHISFVIEQGESFSQISDNLESNGLISSDFWFWFYAKLDGSAKLVRAGSYELLPHESYSKLIDILTEYSQGQDVSITIPEGYTIDQIGDIVVENFNIQRGDWDYWTGLNSPLEQNEFIKKAQKPDDVDLEGYLFPNTYRFYPDATAEDIVSELVNQTANKLNEIDLSLEDGETVHDLLTLASIVQKEVADEDEMKLVASVFENRLELGMALQSCATVNYITGKDDPAVSAEDLEIDSPYNSYMYSGLVPGPISNPGLAAIEAANDPAQSDYLYFLSTPNGETMYAKTFDEHVANKNKYMY
jgi:UPF0755 protein